MKFIYTSLLFLISQSFFSQSGQVETSFGTNGLKKIYTNLYGYQSTPNPPSVDKVIFGTTLETVYLTNDIKTKAVTLLGMSTTAGFQFPDYVSGWDQITRFNDALLDTNQFIYISGYTSKEDNNKAFFVARLKRGTGSNYNKWGMDSNFNIDGKLVFDTPETDEESTSIKVAANGKIVITGYSGNKGIIVRYNSDGFLDKTYNQCGFCTFQIGSNCKPTSMVVQSDDKIVVAGNSFNGSDTDFFLTRYNTNGTLDTTFGNSGIVIKDVNNHDNTGNTLALAADGSLMVGGKAYTITDPLACNTLYGYNASIFKYDSNGQSVTSFTNGNIPGAHIVPGCYIFGTDRYPLKSEVVDLIYKNGWIYGLYSQERFNSPYITSRAIQLAIDAAPNSGLGYSLNVPLSNWNVEPVCVAIKPSDNTFYTVLNYDNCNVGKTPFLKMPTNNFPTTCNSTSEASISFKKIIKTASGYYALDLNKKLFKMDANFVLDVTFATNGYISDVMNFNVDSDEKIICNLGEGNANSTKILLARFNPDGKMDPLFGFYGTFPLTPLRWINGISVTASNQYFVTKTSAESGANILSVSKMTNTGKLDTAFGTGGVLNLYSVPIVSGYAQLFAAEDIVKDNAGNYYALAYHLASNNVPNFIKIIKFTPIGTIDTTFGTNGVFDVSNIALDASHQVNIAINTADGKLLVHNKNSLVQVNLNGSFDTGFGTNGLFDLNSVIADFTINRVLVKGSDYFIGGKDVSSSKSDIVKMDRFGALDTSFGTNGYYQELSAGNPNYVHLRDMFFFDANSILFYQNGIKKIQ